MNIGTLLPRHARYRPNHTAVVFEAQRFTYREFNARVNQTANALHGLGLRKGDKLATILPNCLEQLELLWAVAKLGVVIVPLSPMLRGSGLLRLLDDADTVAIVTDRSFAGVLDPLRVHLPRISPDRYVLVDGAAEGYRSYQTLTAVAGKNEPPAVAIDRDDAYNIIYSSGTTGLPKGIVHTYAVRAAYCTSFATSYGITPDSVILHAGSLVFNGAFLTLMPAFFQGATYVLMKQFDAKKLIEIVSREKVTHIKMVPSQIVAMLHAPTFAYEKLQSLELIGSVGAPLHLEHKEALTNVLPDRFCELYGLTEGFVTILDRSDYPAKPSSVGVPPPLFEMRIVDQEGEDAAPHTVGEIVGRGPILMHGYYKQPALTAEAIRDGWLYSGDLGYVDEDGFLYLVDRQKDMIISGGVNVYPRDIEEILVQHPAVREAAVFGVPDEKWGETPQAAVILQHPDSASPEEIRDWVNARVAAKFQRVRAVTIASEFPRSVAGKTLKRVLREPFWAERDTQI